MKNASHLALAIVLVSLSVLACGVSAPTGATPQAATPVDAQPSLESSSETATPTLVPAVSPTPTPAPLQLEIVESQVWTDRDGNVRANVLLRNPHDFPVAPAYRANAELLNAAGDFMRIENLYFLDGISGGNGFFLPGETIAANACFTCEQAPLSEAWDSVQYEAVIKDATGTWEYYTDVEASVGNVTFEGDNPIFGVNGSVKNNTAVALNRISVRVFVYDQAGKLVGAAEVSAWDVGPGATASLDGYGIGQAPEGKVKYEVTALGVKY